MTNNQNSDSDRPINENAAGCSAAADFSDIEAINNLETARMALRWALERIHALQLAKEDSDRKAVAEAAARGHAESEYKDIQRVLALRGQEDTQRQAYFAKLEAYLSQHFAGKLDLAALMKREIQTAELESLLADRQLGLDKEFAARREKLDADYKRAKFETEQAAEAQVARAKAEAHESRKHWERSLAVKLAEFAEREVRIKAEEDALSQRQAQFDAFCREQRARLEVDIKAFHDSVEDQMRLRVNSAERFLTSRHDVAASTWSREKAALLKEIENWREQALAYLPQLAVLQKAILEAREAARQAKLDGEAQAHRFQLERGGLAAERAALAQELAELRARHEDELALLCGRDRDLRDAEDVRHRAEAELKEAQAHLRRFQEEAAAREEAARKQLSVLEQERRKLMDAFSRRMADMDDLESLLISRFQDFEADIHNRDLAWREREELNRRRDHDWHGRQSDWQAEQARKSDQVEALKSHLIEIIQSYKSKMAQAEKTETPQ
jgi:hypothetical protein